MAWYKKLWKGIKKVGKYVAPMAAVAAPFIPGVGSAISGAIGKVGGWLGGGSSAQSMGPNDGPQNPNQVQVTSQRPGFDWMGAAEKVLPSFLGWYGQQQTNSAQMAQAQKQMDFQAEQTGSSYQRGVADMKAAGLNPMLAYSQGGAASGGGAQATIGNEVGAGMSSAIQMAMTKQQLAQMAAQTENTQANTGKTEVDTRLAEEDVILRSTQGRHESERIKHTEELAREVALRNYVNRATQSAQISLASSSADLRRHESDKESWLKQHAKADLPGKQAYGNFWSTGYGKSYPYLEKSGELANSASSVYHKLKPWSLGAGR